MNLSSSEDKYEKEVPKNKEIRAVEDNDTLVVKEKNSILIDNVTVEENKRGSSVINAVDNSANIENLSSSEDKYEKEVPKSKEIREEEDNDTLVVKENNSILIDNVTVEENKRGSSVINAVNNFSNIENSSSSEDKYEKEVPKSKDIRAVEDNDTLVVKENYSILIDNVTVEENKRGSSEINAVDNFSNIENLSRSEDKYEKEVPKSNEIREVADNDKRIGKKNNSILIDVTVEENNRECSSLVTNAVENFANIAESTANSLLGLFNLDVNTEPKVGCSKEMNGYIQFGNGGKSTSVKFINGGNQNISINNGNMNISINYSGNKNYQTMSINNNSVHVNSIQVNQIEETISESMSGIRINANRKTINISATGIDVSDGSIKRRDADDSRVIWINGNRNIIYANVFSIKVNGNRNIIHASKYQVQKDNSDVNNSEKCVIDGNRNIIYAGVRELKQNGNRNITHFAEPGRLRLDHNGEGEGIRITTNGNRNEIHGNGTKYEIGTSRCNAIFTMQEFRSY